MIPAKYNITPQTDGDSFDYVQFNFLDVNGVPIDLTGVTIKVQFRKSIKKGILVKELTIGNGLNWINQALGQFSINSFIINWGVGTYYYDIQFTYPLGEVKTYLHGSVLINDQITL